MIQILELALRYITAYTEKPCLEPARAMSLQILELYTMIWCGRMVYILSIIF